MSVTAAQRFTRHNPCPICGGYDEAERGQGVRCWGYISDDGRYVHSTREERAGNLRMHTESQTYAHRLNGDCDCGQRHGADTPATMGWRIVATYDYQDAGGKLLYQVVRYDPKDFRQRRPDGKGGWVWSLDGVRRVLYRLPELVAAPADAALHVTEGEKDADNLRALGYIATTCPGGAGKWRGEYAAVLSGHPVVVHQHDDAPGRRHAEEVAATLAPICPSIKVVLPPGVGEHGDISDWLAAEHSLADLQVLVESTPLWQPHAQGGVDAKGGTKVALLRLTSLESLLSEPPERVNWVWNLTLPVGGVSVCVAKPKVGKSTLARNLALAVARGQPFLGRPTSQGAVVFLALEDKRSEVKRHFAEMGATGDEPIHIHIGVAPEKALEALGQAIHETRPALAVVDPLFRFLRARDVNDYAVVSALFEPLMALARNSGCHILALHHAGKADREGGDGILGSTAIFGAVDTALILRRSVDGPRSLESVQRYGEDIPKTALCFDEATHTLSAGGTVEALELARARENILTFMAAGVLTEPEIRDGVEGKTRTLSTALRQLHQDGLVSREGAGRRGDPYRYARILVPTKVPPGDGSGSTADMENTRLLVPSVCREQAEQEKQESSNGALADVGRV